MVEYIYLMLIKPMEKTVAKSPTSEPESGAIDLYYDYAVQKGWILPLSQKRSQVMCERLLDAANCVFAEKGFGAAKISDIAEAAGSSVGIFYKRFSDKEALFYVLQHRHLKKSEHQIDQMVANPDFDLTTHDVLYHFVGSSVKYILREAGFERALVEMSLRDNEVWKAQSRHNRYVSDRLVDYLVARGELRDVDEDLRKRAHFAVRIIFSTVVNLVAFGPGPYEADDSRVISSLTENLWAFVREEQFRAEEIQRRIHSAR